MPSTRLERLLLACRVLGDALVVLAAFGLAAALTLFSGRAGASAGEHFATHLIAALVYLGILFFLLHKAGLYEVTPNLLNFGELLQALNLVLFAGVLFCTLLFLVRPDFLSPASTLIGIAATAGLILFVRRGLSALLSKLRRRGAIKRRVLIYGCGEVGQLVMKNIVRAPQAGWDVVGFVDDFKPRGMAVPVYLGVGKGYVHRTVLGRIGDLGELVHRYGVDEILVTIPMSRLARQRELEAIAKQHSVQIGVVPHLGDFRPDLLQITDISAMPVLRLPSARSPFIDSVVKRALDLSLASLALVVTAPVWILAAIGIALDSPGPILFRQRRVGLGGQEFWLYKFRTMFVDSDPYARAPRRLDDPRITPIGRLLRATGLDELPQLLNVLRGEMSLVGPRPEMPFIVQEYGIEQRERLKARPGITGIWQVSADRDLEIHENIEYDLYYIRFRSLLLDLVILFETAAYTSKLVVRLIGDRLRRRAEPLQGRLSREDGSMPARDSTVLVAVDQRRSGGSPKGLEAILPLIPEMSRDFDIRMLVADANVGLVDRLLQETLGGRQPQAWPEYVPYRGVDELLTQVESARIVITDLEHVAGRAVSSGAEVIAFSPQSRNVEIRNRKGELPEQVLSQLHQSLAEDGRRNIGGNGHGLGPSSRSAPDGTTPSL